MATAGGEGFLNRLNPLKVIAPINAINSRKLRLEMHASNHTPIFPHLFRLGFDFLIAVKKAGVRPQDTIVLFRSSFEIIDLVPNPFIVIGPLQHGSRWRSTGVDSSLDSFIVGPGNAGSKG